LQRESGELDFEREKWRHEVRLREREIELKQQELSKSLWRNPLFLAILAAAIAATGNAGVAWLNGRQERALQQDRSTAQIDLEQKKLFFRTILNALKQRPPVFLK
jgi:hypothetical protein